MLMRLLQIADAAGLADAPEREAFMREMETQYDRGLFGGGKNLEEAVALMRPLTVELQRADEIMEVLPEAKRRDYGFRQFVPAVAHIIEACRTVDQSVSDILQLWAAHATKEETPRIFRDALGFLRAQLWPRVPAPPDHSETDVAHAKKLPIQAKP